VGCGLLGDTWNLLAPAYGQVPAEASFGGFVEDGFVFSQLAENLGAFAAELVGIGFEHRNQGSQGAETFFWRVPLGRRKAPEEIGIAATFLNQESHGVLVGGEKLEQGFDAKLKRELLNRALVARQYATVYIDVVAGVIALDHNVHRGCHWDECSSGWGVN
jgi:hypothetical protein